MAMATTALKSNALVRGFTAIWLISTAAAAVVGAHQTGLFGYSSYSTDHQDYVMAATTPSALALALLGLVVFVALARTELRIAEFQIAPLWRRYIALVVDFWFTVFTSAAVLPLVPLMLEYRRTGEFRWSFSRDYSVPSDWVGGPLVLIGIAAMVAYFALTLANRRQTVGRWMMRIATVQVDGSAIRMPVLAASRRLYKELRELLSFASLTNAVKGRQADRRTWHDAGDSFIVVRY